MSEGQVTFSSVTKRTYRWPGTDSVEMREIRSLPPVLPRSTVEPMLLAGCKALIPQWPKDKSHGKFAITGSKVVVIGQTISKFATVVVSTCTSLRRPHYAGCVTVATQDKVLIVTENYTIVRF